MGGVIIMPGDLNTPEGAGCIFTWAIGCSGVMAACCAIATLKDAKATNRSTANANGLVLLITSLLWLELVSKCRRAHQPRRTCVPHRTRRLDGKPSCDLPNCLFGIT